MNPWMTDGEKRLFAKYLDSANNYFEFGSGGSTVWAAARPNIQTITSIESDSKYCKIVQDAAPRANVQWVYIGHVKDCGNPSDRSQIERWHNYYDSYADRQVEPDLVLIDGRFRVACALTVFFHSNTNEKQIVMIHDFRVRPYYHSILAFFDIIEECENLVVLKARQTVDDKTNALRMLTAYANDPR
jgi:hypothetical protein